MAISSKAAIRKGIKRKLEQLSSTIIAEQSREVGEKVISLPLYTQAKAISIYLSMPKEIDTTHLIQQSFEMKKRVFIPKIVGRKSGDMIMVEIKSYADILSFPKNAWGIPEPDEAYITAHHDVTLLKVIDLVLVPGVAFDVDCGRVGHGKGYYDHFLSKLEKCRQDTDDARQIGTVALSLSEQMVTDEALPKEEHDRTLDYVVTPDHIFQRSQ